MSPKDQEAFLETLLATVHEALARNVPAELSIRFAPPQVPTIQRLPPWPAAPASSHYRRLYGMTLREMAQRYHRSVSTVWTWLKKGWRPGN